MKLSSIISFIMALPGLQKTWDESQIKSAVVLERYYRDNGMWKELRQSYHPDASKTEIKITWFRGDADGFVEGSEEMANAGSRSVHNIAPALVRINGDKALSESVCSILARFDYQGVQYDLISYARLLSRLERVDSEWKLLTMEALYDKDTIVPVVPNSPTTNLTIPEDSRESYKGLGWLLAQRGFTIDPDLPGVDRPGSSEAVIEEGVEWLNE